jgi:hypothetical protein
VCDTPTIFGDVGAMNTCVGFCSSFQFKALLTSLTRAPLRAVNLFTSPAPKPPHHIHQSQDATERGYEEEGAEGAVYREPNRELPIEGITRI